MARWTVGELVEELGNYADDAQIMVLSGEEFYEEFVINEEPKPDGIDGIIVCPVLVLIS